MSALSINPPYPVFPDLDGQPLEDGYIWIGVAGLNPLTNPITVYWDASLTIPAPQPIRTIGGYPASNGTPARLYVNSDYSIRVTNKNGSVVYSAPAATERYSDVVIGTINAVDIEYQPAGSSAVTTNAQEALRRIVSVFDFMTPSEIADVQSGAATLDVTQAIKKAVDHLVSLAPNLFVGGSPVNLTDLISPNLVLFFPTGKYLIGQPNGVEIPAQIGPSTGLQASLHFESSLAGASITGNEINIGFNFTGGGFRNKFSNIAFGKFATAIKLNTGNKNESMLQIDSCRSQSNDIFIDTVSYAASRSTMIDIRGTMCGDTRVFVKHYTDHMTIRDCWIYAKKDSYDALLYLSGDGNVNIYDTFMIPFGQQIPNPQNARWIDFVTDSTQSTVADMSTKFLNIRGCRMSLESARPFIWTFADTNPFQPNAISSITIEDSYLGGTGGAPVINYKTGYPGSVTLKNCKIFASYFIVAVDPTNLTGPQPSAPGAWSNHVIMIDEATRLAQTNGQQINLGNLVDPELFPFYYDTTSQTSKYRRSIHSNVDYRIRAVATATPNTVKATFDIFFDSTNTVGNRDILSFILVTVSDANGVGFANPSYRAQAVSLVSIVGLEDLGGNIVKRLVTTPLQVANGGPQPLTWDATPTVFWGTGDTGSADIDAYSATGVEDHITFTWASVDPNISWAYVIPIAGLRDNQCRLMQYDVW